MAVTTDARAQLWRTQFDEQLTGDMMERLLKQTIALVRRIERRTPWCDQQTADDRLHTVIAQLLAGTLHWDPVRVDLERYLLAAIASDLSHELAHAMRFRHTSLDDDRADTEGLEIQTSEALAATRESKQEAPREAWWSAAMSEFRRVSAGDVCVLAILDAYDHEHFTRGAVLQHTGMTARQYQAAHERLVTVARHIDEDIRGLITQAIA